MAVESATFKNEVRGQEGGEGGVRLQGAETKNIHKKNAEVGEGGVRGSKAGNRYGGHRFGGVGRVAGGRAGSAVRSVLT